MAPTLGTDGHSARERDDTKSPWIDRSRITGVCQDPVDDLSDLSVGSNAKGMRDDAGSRQDEARAAPRGCGDEAAELLV